MNKGIVIAAIFALMAFIAVDHLGRPKADVLVSQPSYDALIKQINKNELRNLHSLLVWRQGEVELELYRETKGMYGFETLDKVPVGPDVIHNVHSVSKSITALLLMIAIDDGKIDSVETPVLTYFPELNIDSEDPRWAITLFDALNMETGLAIDELEPDYSDPNNDWTAMFQQTDLVSWIFAKDVAEAPGNTYRYTGAATMLLALAIERAYQQPIDTIAEEKLFLPLGITNYKWEKYPQNDLVGADFGLRMTSRDLLKVGQLILARGQWQNQTVIQPHWFDALAESNAQARHIASGYSHQFWLPEKLSGAIMAIGFGEQYLIVSPESDTVIVTTAGNYQGPQAIWRHIDAIL
uniref:serine hydrolase domain-containing protein n=1 Tax=Thaumasiovibrio occultus TaxID=1891184 RepID=UPI00131E1FA3|nr:serine hydrolase domain-containing protein [Thaumasiovibrio occultus]